MVPGVEEQGDEPFQTKSNSGNGRGSASGEHRAGPFVTERNRRRLSPASHVTVVIRESSAKVQQKTNAPAVTAIADRICIKCHTYLCLTARVYCPPLTLDTAMSVPWWPMLGQKKREFEHAPVAGSSLHGC